jgi:hypothetical protein
MVAGCFPRMPLIPHIPDSSCNMRVSPTGEEPILELALPNSLRRLLL